MAGKQPAIPITVPALRMTMFMTTPSRTISETHWYSQAGADPSVVMAAALKLVPYRVALLAKGALLTEVRVSNDKIYRDSLVNTSSADYIPTSDDPENLGNDAIIIRCESGSLYRKVFYLGGIPDNTIVAGKYNFINAGAFPKELNQYLQALLGKQASTAGAWGFVALDRSSACPRVGVTVLSVATAPTVVTIVTKDPHGCSNGDIIRLSYVPNASIQLPFNQLWAVTVVNTTTVTLNQFPTQLNPYSQGIGGFLTKQQKILVPYTAAYVDGVNTRKRGARSFLPLGRSKKKHTIGY
jgi:hypothetical protein